MYVSHIESLEITLGVRPYVRPIFGCHSVFMAPCGQVLLAEDQRHCQVVQIGAIND